MRRFRPKRVRRRFSRRVKRKSFGRRRTTRPIRVGYRW